MLFSFGTNAGRTCAFRDKGFPLWLIGYSSGQQRVTTSFARHYDNSTSHGWMEVWSRSLIVIGIDCAVCVDRRFTFASSGLKWSCLIDESGCSWELLVVSGDFTSKCVLEINKGTDHASVLTMWHRQLALLVFEDWFYWALRRELRLIYGHFITSLKRELWPQHARGFFIFIVRTFRSIDFKTRSEWCVDRKVSFFAAFASFSAFLRQLCSSLATKCTRRERGGWRHKSGEDSLVKKSIRKQNGGRRRKADVKLRNCSSESIELQPSRSCLIC